MKATSNGRLLSTVFVDYDNIYLSLKRKSEDAAKAFAKNAPLWLKEIESGRLITPTNGPGVDMQRRIVMNRCYGNPVPRRNQSDNSTDMNSFPFVRHHFLRAGFEVVDCPPLTAQLKNSSDIRMVMDVRDYLNHDTYFEEFVILSGDADFTPLLHRLRAHARRTVIFANDYTASPYTAISDGEIRESDLIAFLTGSRLTADAPVAQITTGDAQPIQQAPALPPAQPALPSPQQLEIARRDIINEVVSVVRMTTHPVPLEALADRAVRNLGHEKTAGSAWGGAGTFRELLQRALPQGLKLSEQPPYFVYDTTRQNRGELARSEQPRAAETVTAPAPRSEAYEALARPEQAAPRGAREPQAPAHAAYQPQPQAQGYAQPQAPAYQPQAFQQPPAPQQPVQRPAEPAPAYQQPAGYGAPQAPAHSPAQEAAPQRAALPPLPQPPPQQTPPLATLQQPYRSQQAEQIHQRLAMPPAVTTPAPQPQPQPRQADTASAIQQSIARIHEACQAPPLSPPEYRALFDIMAQEINSNGLLGAQTLTSISARAQELGIELRRDDVRFVLEVVSEADPWFEQGASASLFASRFRNFVVARCRGQGLNLTAEELDLIEAWFAASAQQTGQSRNAPVTAPRAPAAQAAPAQQAPLQQTPLQQTGTGERWWNLDEGRTAEADANDEMPRIVRARQRG